MARILITGASAGIGRALALELGKREHHVIAVARNSSRLAELSELCAMIESVVADLTVADDRERLALIANSKQFLNVLVNCAAACWPAPLEDQTEEHVVDTLDVGVMAPILLTRLLLPSLRASGGVIINMSSIAGRIGSPGNSVYTAAKFALEGFSESLAYEVAEHGIRVRVVQPAYVATAMMAGTPPVIEGSAYASFAKATKDRLTANNDRSVSPELVASQIAGVIEESLGSSVSFLRVPIDDVARDMIVERYMTADAEWFTKFSTAVDAWRD